MGAGDDTFAWDPGDGSDVVEGEAGDDSMLFIGANIAEKIDVSANGNRVRFARDIGNVTMDTAGLERIDFQALGAADVVNVGDLTGTDLASLLVDLEGAPGAGDGSADRIVVSGTDGDDAITVNGDASEVNVSGLHTTVAILNPEFANDRLEVNTLEGHGHRGFQRARARRDSALRGRRARSVERLDRRGCAGPLDPEGPRRDGYCPGFFVLPARRS